MWGKSESTALNLKTGRGALKGPQGGLRVFQTAGIFKESRVDLFGEPDTMWGGGGPGI